MEVRSASQWLGWGVHRTLEWVLSFYSAVALANEHVSFITDIGTQQHTHPTTKHVPATESIKMHMVFYALLNPNNCAKSLIPNHSRRRIVCKPFPYAKT